VNSFLWLRRGKDTLAFANITGAMVFQGTLLPALGILLTPWGARAGGGGRPGYNARGEHVHVADAASRCAPAVPHAV